MPTKRGVPDPAQSINSAYAARATDAPGNEPGIAESPAFGAPRVLDGALDLVLMVLIAISGIGISIYLTTVHYAKVPLLCSVGGVVDCSAVTTSVYSVVPGTTIPITLPGIGWFAVLGALTLLGWRAQLRGDPALLRLAIVQLVWNTLGLLGVFYLVFAEVVKLHKICEWCTVVHILTLLSFILVLLRVQWYAAPDDETE